MDPRANRRGSRRRRGMALMLALFVMAAATMLVVTILDTQTLQYAALRNTADFDRARYLAEAGIQHGLSVLEPDFNASGATGFSIPSTEFPAGSGNRYSAEVGPLQPDGTRVVSSQGMAGTFTRRLQVRIKMGG